MSDKKSPSGWVIVKVDQTKLCDAGWIREKKIRSCGVFFLINADLHVHICSFTPSLEAWPMQGFATFKTHKAADEDEGETEMEMLNSEEIVSYFGVEVLQEPWQAVSNVPAQEEGEEDEAYRRRVAEEVRETVCGDPVWF